MLPGIGRRHFLIGAAAAAAAVATGCGSSGDGTSAEGDGKAAGAPTTAPAPSWSGKDPFTLGVASGDPTTTSVILWTRLAPEPTAEDGLGGMPGDDVPVAWEVATDRAFSKVVAAGTATAAADHAHAVHVDAKGLAPATDHWYRFRLGRHTSPVARTRTLPEGPVDRIGLAIVNCQMYEGGSYAAYRHLQDEDVALVAHLGDYIYEYAGGTGEGRHSLPNRMVRTLPDFRVRYASYKLDPDLQGAHHRFPFVATWDDHEAANNYMGDTMPGDPPADKVMAIRAAAYQAWWEHTPARLPAPVDGTLDVYQAIDLGDLARLYLLDERQYAAEPPCRDASEAGLDYGNCDEVPKDRTRLGQAQEDWFAHAASTSRATWNLIGNPVVLAGVDAGKGDEAAYYLDTWDGYPTARKRLIAQLAKVDNPVVLTGDYHAGMVLDVHETPFDQASPVVAPEFMAPPISSPLFSEDVTARTPQLRQQLNGHGYLTVDVTPTRLTARMRVLEDVKDPRTAISTAATWTVAPGNPVAEQA
ncbi:MAG: alkaline phosphatase D family protein [Acidimicrobiales bacterium]